MPRTVAKKPRITDVEAKDLLIKDKAVVKRHMSKILCTCYPVTSS